MTRSDDPPGAIRRPMLPSANAADPQHLRPRSFATLVRMARDIYPHDQVPDAFYVAAVREHDTVVAATQVEAAIAVLDAAARARGYACYLGVERAHDRVDLLRVIEDMSAFRALRSGLVTGLYSQSALWPQLAAGPREDRAAL